VHSIPQGEIQFSAIKLSIELEPFSIVQTSELIKISDE
jgi:hypothetical protein